jgi:tetratricopeptide (TPR) repeat protein
LVHTQFFGAGTITSFSGVSLNISGDVYYNEGDLVSAIREYRLGLNLNPDNVNLLNSLGVIYAQIDSQAKAIPLFERAIALNPADFMALFNLGFAHLCNGEADKAITYFEQAMRIDASYFDLLLQLGQLYCQRGQFKKAVKVLTKAEQCVTSPHGPSVESKPWERCEPWQGERHELGHGLVYRYLGEAYKGIGDNRQAMTYLQRAARYNSRDSEALSLLGELYAAEQQGLDIALTFCRQAVEIDSAKAPYWYRMAGVLWCREEWDEAMNAAQHCLSLDPGHLEAMMLKAAIHEKLQQPVLARGTYEKVLRLDGTHTRAAKALKRINQTRRSR